MSQPTIDQDVVRLEIVDHVAVVTICRPAAMNAVDASVSAAIGQALEQADADPGVRALVLTGSGGAFCAGADLKALARGEAVHDPDHPEWGFAGWTQHPVRVPTIAAVNGFALGGGTELVLAADLAVADPGATFGLPEVTRGLLAAAGGIIRLQRQVPFKRALEMALTGESIAADEAHALGLVNRVSAPGKALEEAMQLAHRIADNAPVAVRETKQVMHGTAAMGSDWEPEVWQVSNRAMGRIFRSDDFREGTRAFAEKRRPEWSGR
ncbi:crotonase/enoyl-CoA hydratase family protein [Nocardioides daejeonensis]|uniref:crotonase/enoyl-CoA hydratase family protein n=1 Tax=Nocardioides daejeonensis TaxID=1046556 RepID=UPI000D740167|nr:crotonase/enoyl-CoA hydratase family protein [Nocardioides daejeonensis]